MKRRTFLKNLINTIAIVTIPIGFIDCDRRERLLLVDDNGDYSTIPTVEEEIIRMMAKRFSEDLEKEYIKGWT